MFKPQDSPRIFACPPGIDFPKALIDGLDSRMAGAPPDRLARVEILVNTRRMQRRIWQLFDNGPARLLPSIRLITDLANDPICRGTPAAVSTLRRRLELSQLISKLLDKEPDLAPRSALFDLADSLAMLLAEMHDEGVSPKDIAQLDVADTSGHWQRSQKFLAIAAQFFDVNSGQAPDQTARQRMVTEQLIAAWQNSPPQHPVLIAGSTGSRGSTALLMQAVSRLPQGAVILPGFDFDMPAPVWNKLNDPMASEDHPQYRLFQMADSVGVGIADVQPWAAEQNPVSPSRNKLISLALRPAPVTSQWMQEGPALGGVPEAAVGMTLIEAPSDRVEALCIALALRKAAETGKTAALVTPNQLLTRQVSAALDRWRIEPDVSVGKPLDQSAPGRLFRHVAELFGRPLSGEALLVLLKHPLVNSGGDGRGAHLGWTHRLELSLRRNGPPFPVRDDILRWAEGDQETPERSAWATWVTDCICHHEDISQRPLGDHLAHHLKTVMALVAGPEQLDVQELWRGAAGAELERTIGEFQQEAGHGGSVGSRDYVTLFQGILRKSEVRDPVRPHPNIMIWGTLEARVQGADLVILGGLNDGVWPEMPPADPWLNRELRHRVGLLLPERKIGLSAHDFQQAIAAKEVILTRAIRDAQTPTVPSRWLNRLTNLMEGMSDHGRDGLAGMRARGQKWLGLAEALEYVSPTPPALRPAPQPPVKTRPKSLSVTAITRLIRDPFAIYAQYILGLRRLDPIRRKPDAPLRGTVLHMVMEQFIKDADLSVGQQALKSQLLAITDTILEQEAPWPAARVLWRSRIERVTDVFLQDEYIRQSRGHPKLLEQSGAHRFAELEFTLTAKADRIDQTEDGQYIIYDYKTGSPPTKDQLRYFDKQLLLEAVIIEAGGFSKLRSAPVSQVAHIGLGSTPKFNPVDMESGEIQTIAAELQKLIRQYQSEDQGYTSRRAMTKMRFAGDFDHLARFGEWDETQSPAPEKVGK